MSNTGHQIFAIFHDRESFLGREGTDEKWHLIAKPLFRQETFTGDDAI